MSRKTIPPRELEQSLLDRLAFLNQQTAARPKRAASRGHARVRMAGLIGIFALLAIGTTGAFAVHDEGFQLEGNASASDIHHGTVCVDTDNDKQTPCVNVPQGDLTGAFAGSLDWDSLFNIQAGAAPGNALGTVSGPKASLPAPFTNADFQKDFKNTGTTFLTGDDTTFATGSKDTLDVTPGWQCNHDNNVNGKTDIINGFAALAEIGGDQVFYFGLEKDVDNGDNNVGMWLFQDQTVGCSSSSGTASFTGHHTVGDLLVVSAFTNGGGVSNIDVYQWIGNVQGGPLQKLGSGVDCLVQGGADSVCATVFEPNTKGGADLLQMPWLSADSSVVNAKHPSPNFYEGGINLSAFPQFANKCFTKYMLDTRSSQSPTATLFDYVEGNIGTCNPAIEVTKTPSVTDVCAGSDTSVTYTYTVENIGDVDLTNVDISDDKIAGLQAAFEAENGGDSLAEGSGVVTFTVNATINATTTNVVTVDADSIAGANSASDTATATVTAHDCTISITKTPDNDDVCSGSDTEITYTYEVTNNSDLFDATVDVWDDAGTPADTSDDVLVQDNLAVAAGDTESFTYAFTVNVTTKNTATATATFNDTDSSTDTATADATVTAHTCTITVTKTPSTTNVCNGKPVDYDYTVKNNSDLFSWTGDVVDDMGTPGNTADDTVLANDVTITAGQTKNYELNGVNITGSVTNTVTADGAFNDPAATSASDDASATVTGHVCTITVTKTPSTTDVCNGSPVDYDYTVKNNSDLFSWTGDVVDDMGTPADTSDDTVLANDVTIAAGVTKNYELNGVSITGSVTNTVTASGAFNDPSSTSASDTADATVTGHECTIDITKTPDITDVCNGSSTTVTYTYEVTNNSPDFDWTGDVVDDAGTPGDTADDVKVKDDLTVAKGDSESFTYQFTVGGTVTNTVDADGAFNDPASSTASASASAKVTGHDCTITLTKTVDDQDVCAGSTVTYSYKVHNNSDLFTWTGDITDDNGTPGNSADDFTVASGVSVDAGQDSQTYTHNSVIGDGSVTNTATADGDFDDADATPASDTDDATTEGHDCTITVTKSADDNDICVGHSTTYDFSVTNNSDEFGWDGSLEDDVVGTIAASVHLDPGETKNFNDVAGPALQVDTTNTVTADGAFDDPDATAAGDTASDTVKVHDCTITITKTPSDTEVCNGDTVNYSYVVTNNSDEFDWTGDVVDDMGTPADPADDVTLADDVTILASGHLDLSLNNVVINGTVHNTVTADGNMNDPDATAASDSADATVTGSGCGQGCTPGFWQGGAGAALWNTINDPQWVAAGGAGTNPFASTQKFNSFFVTSGSSQVDNMTMGAIVGSGGTNSWARKAARDVVAAYLNASFGMNYPVLPAAIITEYNAAVAGGNAGLQAFHLKYAAFNQLGCNIFG